jgi:hypothetical protein
MAAQAGLPGITAALDQARDLLSTQDSLVEVRQAQRFIALAVETAKLLQSPRAGVDPTVASQARFLQGEGVKLGFRAECVLADQVDAAQASGELAPPHRQKSVGGTDANDENKESVGGTYASLPTLSDAGIKRWELRDARKSRDLEAAHPGVHDAVVDETVLSGEKPTKSRVRDQIKDRLAVADAADPMTADYGAGETVTAPRRRRRPSAPISPVERERRNLVGALTALRTCLSSPRVSAVVRALSSDDFDLLQAVPDQIRDALRPRLVAGTDVDGAQPSQETSQ